MQIKYFKTAEQAAAACSLWIDSVYTNKFQDAFAISRLKLVQFDKGFAWQRGEFGPYLMTSDFAKEPSRIRPPGKLFSSFECEVIAKGVNHAKG